MEAMAGLKPSIFRFPGGNNMEGVAPPYWWNWTQTIGPLIDRYSVSLLRRPLRRTLLLTNRIGPATLERGDILTRMDWALLNTYYGLKI